MAYLCMLTHVYDDALKNMCKSHNVHTDPVIINNSKLSYMNTSGTDVLVLYSGSREDIAKMIDSYLKMIECQDWYASVQRKKLLSEIYE